MKVVIASMVALALATSTSAQDFALDDSTLAAAACEVIPAIEEELDVDLPALVIRFTTRRELARTIADQQIEVLSRILGDEAVARAQAQSSGDMLASGLAGFYDDIGKVVLVCRENIIDMARMPSVARILSDEGVRALLAHECVHAADDRRYGFLQGLSTVDSMEELMAYRAVTEGHAQAVARRICERMGWTDGFTVLTRSILEPPDFHLGEGMRQLVRAVTEQTASAYRDGERFMLAVELEGGAVAVERAFRSPPTDLLIIENPEWFLDPSARPEPDDALSVALRSLAARYGGEAWDAQESSATEGQLRSELDLLPPEYIDWVIGDIEECRLIALSRQRSLWPKRIDGRIIRFSDAQAARRCFDWFRKLGRISNDKMSDGLMQVTTAEYLDTAGDGWEGEIVRRTIQVGRMEDEILSIMALRGSALLDVMWRGLTVTEEDMTAIAGDILALADVGERE